ncbi:hypothetical protein Pcinc_008397 [Petrolisthes cinctipes]|uniref:PiggyBac transposable element-derived protein domain-containing protein n=1 Tax=Petrolisthes cinctipes TaxID=88211 RepID=A0AAE1KWG9_PETCI|nr:hypothetical protein Pcinc_008397 [Petrolisthes cinctipes]
MLQTTSQQQYKSVNYCTVSVSLWSVYGLPTHPAAPEAPKCCRSPQGLQRFTISHFTNCQCIPAKMWSDNESEYDVDDPGQLSDFADTASIVTHLSTDDEVQDDPLFDDLEFEDSADDEEWQCVVDNDRGPLPIPFTATPGPHHIPPNTARPIDYFNLFFDNTVIDNIVEETNRYSNQYIEAKKEYLANHPQSLTHQWIQQGHTYAEEIRALLGILFNMGFIKKPTLDSYWDTTHPSLDTPWFPKHFNRNRFQLLLKFLHFNDNSQLDENSENNILFKIQPLIDHFQAAFTTYFHPDKNISLDESMIGYKGATPSLRQYLPNKHARYGIKVWCVCDVSTGYTFTFEIYEERARTPANNIRTTHSTAIRLLTRASLCNIGHNVGFDNFFSSPSLFKDLYQRATTATGTVRRNRVGLPDALQGTKVLRNEVAEWRQGSLLCVKYKDGNKTPVHLISTSCSGGFSQTTNRQGKKVSRPNIVVEYNKIMGGVDLKDTKLYAYLPEKQTVKWTTKVAFYLFGTALLNSYIVYKKHATGRILTRMNFTMSVIDELMKKYEPQKVQCRRRTREEIEERQQQTFVTQINTNIPVPHTPPHKMIKLPKKKLRNCVAGHNHRVRSNYICAECNVGLCVTCFHGYHDTHHH